MEAPNSNRRRVQPDDDDDDDDDDDCNIQTLKWSSSLHFISMTRALHRGQDKNNTTIVPKN